MNGTGTKQLLNLCHTEDSLRWPTLKSTLILWVGFEHSTFLCSNPWARAARTLGGVCSKGPWDTAITWMVNPHLRHILRHHVLFPFNQQDYGGWSQIYSLLQKVMLQVRTEEKKATINFSMPITSMKILIYTQRCTNSCVKYYFDLSFFW